MWLVLRDYDHAYFTRISLIGVLFDDEILSTEDLCKCMTVKHHIHMVSFMSGGSHRVRCSKAKII